MNKASLPELVPGVAMAVTTYLYMYTWVYTSEVNGKRIREKYLQAILRQEIAYFDDVGAGEVATRIQSDTRKSYWTIQRWMVG
jgi:ATP-binding cassette subfamily B (MDR/TAP) protein 1